MEDELICVRNHSSRRLEFAELILRNIDQKRAQRNHRFLTVSEESGSFGSQVPHLLFHRSTLHIFFVLLLDALGVVAKDNVSEIHSSLVPNGLSELVAFLRLILPKVETGLKDKIPLRNRWLLHLLLNRGSFGGIVEYVV